MLLSILIKNLIFFSRVTGYLKLLWGAHVQGCMVKAGHRLDWFVGFFLMQWTILLRRDGLQCLLVNPILNCSEVPSLVHIDRKTQLFDSCSTHPCPALSVQSLQPSAPALPCFAWFPALSKWSFCIALLLSATPT